ncbi:hypothetical protein pb186bvf_018178 [Paramecium bursaria]
MFIPFSQKYDNSQVEIQDDATTLSNMRQYIWYDDYDEQLQLEIEYYDLKIKIVQQWKEVIHLQVQCDESILLSLFTTNKLTNKEMMQFIHSQCPQDQAYELLKNPFPQVKYDKITNDVKRTFRSNAFFKEPRNQQRLTNILVAYANVDTELRYGQGMNFIAAGLIYLQEDKEDDEMIFNILRYIVLDKDWRQLYQTNTPGLFSCLAKFNFKVKKYLPELYEHFQKVGVTDIGIFISNYYLTLFFSTAPVQFALVILSMFILQGHKILTKLLISMMIFYKAQILKMDDFQILTNFLKKTMAINFFQELQKCRKQQILVKMLLKIKFLKKREPLQQQINVVQQLVNVPFNFGKKFAKFFQQS